MTAPTTILKWGALAITACLLYVALARPDIAAAPAAASPAADPFPFVRSMEGTVPDGDVKQSADGALVVDAELGHLFDYYLAGMGEKDLNAIRSEIERELDRRLKPGAAAQAKRLLASYLAYKGALVGIEQGLKDAGDMASNARARLEARQKLRLSFFSASEIAGLFGFSDAYDMDALARMDISVNPKLSVAQRVEQLAALDKKLSPAMREERDAPARIVLTEESVAKMREQGATDDDIYRVRAAAFSPEGASRLAQLDLDEAAWKGRIKAYLSERAGLPAGAEATLAQLRSKHFNAAELPRLAAYEEAPAIAGATQ